MYHAVGAPFVNMVQENIFVNPVEDHNFVNTLNKNINVENVKNHRFITNNLL